MREVGYSTNTQMYMHGLDFTGSYLLACPLHITLITDSHKHLTTLRMTRGLLRLHQAEYLKRLYAAHRCDGKKFNKTRAACPLTKTWKLGLYQRSPPKFMVS